ncbi:MAG: OmpA family protein [Saprospiraceae bacterium]|nr:OmpA family protein [Saprospiraceae bacterium]
MKKLFFLILLAFVSTMVSMQAQPINRSTPEANLKSAKEAEENGNPYAALDLYEKVYDENKDKALAAKIAQMNYELRDYEKAEKGFNRLVQRDRKSEYVELRYWLAMSMKHNGKHAEAIDMFNQYIAEGADEQLKIAAKREIAGCEIARKAKQPENILINNIGKDANSPQTESSPSYSGGELYYATLMSKEVVVLDGKQGDWYAKIVTASKTGNGAEFGEPKPLGQQINREEWHHGNVSVSPDGKTMFFTRVQLAEKGQDLAESKIFYSVKTSEGWGAANEAVGINGDYLAKHPCEGELFGEKVLFFSSNMPGGKGGFDLYYAPKKSEGVYGLPVNLGEVVNTPGDDVAPFYQDGKLWFSSNGRPTIGGLDVFESQWNGSVWSEPKMLPMGINTTLDDQFYTRSPDGMSGFLVSNRPGPNNLKSKTCCDDIYAWEVERIKVDLNALTFRLKRKGEKENQALKNCTVSVVDVTSKKPINIEEKTNAAANNFPFTLEPEKSYLVVANAPGYKPDTVRFNTVGIKKTTSIEKKLTLRLERKEPEYDTIRLNEPIRLDNILYDFDDDKIRPDAEPDLQYLTDLMNKYPDMKIELSSHTDARGNDAYNEDLSQRRAESARRWLIAKGIKEDRITPKGYGEKVLQNKCSNGVECTEEEHQLNRRTEFKIISGPTSIITEKIEKREKPAPSSGKQAVSEAGTVIQKLMNAIQDTVPPTSDVWQNPADKEVKFKSEVWNYEEVREGVIVKIQFTFVNIGSRALQVELVSGCECMNIKWPKGDIQPGASANIDIDFNTRSYKGDIVKDLDVLFKNTDEKGYPLVKQLKVVGKIN